MLGRVTANIGMGLAAGFAGTVAMTAAQMVEMKITKREGSPMPAKAVEKVFHIEPESDQAEARLGTVVHFAYGTSWGAVRGLLHTLGLPPGRAMATHWTVVQSTEAVMLPSLKLTPPPTQWGGKQLAQDTLFHGIYAAATELAFEYLRRDLENDLSDHRFASGG